MKKSPRFQRQQGVALVIALVLLLVMSLLGVASLRGALLEERMSGALYDRSLSFQAAESALREGEALLNVDPLPTFPAAGCNAQGLCATPNPNDVQRWNDAGFAGWRNGTATGEPALRPQFFVEDMGQAPNWPGCEQEIPINALCLSPRLRITSRSGDPAQGRALTVLQASFAAP